MSMETRTGGCACGAVRFEAELNGLHYHVCHCTRCRKWGGPAFATAAGAIRTVEGAEAVSVWSSSKHGERAFCGACGTHLWWALKAGGFNAVWIGALDESEDMTLASQVFTDQRPEHYAFANKTTDMTGDEVKAAFAGRVKA